MSNPETQIEFDPKSDSQPLVCLVCGSELFTDFISESQSSKVSLRCGGCGDIVGSGIKANAPVDKRAWWSLWLGLSSILLLCLTGIPAIYLGIRSLLRMRYTSARLGDRRAAIAGILLGSTFGVIGGCCILGVGGASLFAIWSRDSTDNFAQTMIVLGGIAEVDMPAQINHGSATSVMNTNQFNFQDAKVLERSCRIVIVYYPPAMIGGTASLKMQLRSEKLRGDAAHKVLEEVPLKWEIAGKTTTVSKYILEEKIFNDESEVKIKNEVLQYVGYVSVKHGIYGVGCAVRQPNDVFPDEASIQAFFNSITPVADPRPSKAWKEAKALVVEEPDKVEPVDAENTKPDEIDKADQDEAE